MISFFAPKYILLKTVTSGGDMASHYPTAVYLKEVLIPKGKIMGWMQGNYAGFPLFYHYFPLLFIFIVFISYIIPIEIAFKIGTILGILIFPLCVYLCFKFLKYKFPIPIIASVFSIVFLFNEGNSMWGGNIPSTLAGEFSYSFSFAIMVLFFGSLYDGIKSKNKICFNAFLIFLIGLSHGYTLIFTGVIAVFFIFTIKSFWNNFKYLFKVFSLAVLLLSFWFIPFLKNLPYVTNFLVKWHITSIFKLIPVILIPFLILAIISLFLNLFDRRTLYFAYIILSCIILYFIAPKLGVLGIRLIPFAQLFIVIFSATFPLLFLSKIRYSQFIPFIVLLTVILWTIPNVNYTKNWIKWNYEGFEEKSTWPLFQKINKYLMKNDTGRAVYEHSPKHDAFGTTRTFESLPYFAKRNTLEGLYMQSSISSPFVFYIQSEISKVRSAPFPEYKYSCLNLPAAPSHLKLFNVSHYIARSPEAKKQARNMQELKLEKKFKDYEIYRLTKNDGHYVVPLRHEPILFLTNNWKKDFHEWFRRSELLDIPLVHIKNPTPEDQKRFTHKIDTLLKVPKIPISTPTPSIKEQIKNEEIEFTTNLIGHPHMIKVSYHPNWKIEGAGKIYLVSPSFMLVYPNTEHVKLSFRRNFFNYLGAIMTLIGLSIILVSAIISFKHARKIKS